MLQILAPSFEEKQCTVLLAPLEVADVKKILSSQTIGEELPRSGVVIFQRMFSLLSFHLVGSEFNPVRPWPVGPRNRGQCFSAPFATKEVESVAPFLIAELFMVVPAISALAP